MDNAANIGAQGQGRLLSEDEALDYLALRERRNPKGAVHWLMRTRRLAFIRLARGMYGFRQSDLDIFIVRSRGAPCGLWKDK